MKYRIPLFVYAVQVTTVLLLVAAVLAVLGIFDETLGWDIFSPRTEKFLYAIFFSCLVLSAFGVALTSVQGMKSGVDSLRKIAGVAEDDAESRSKMRSLKVTGSIILVSVILIFALHVVNQVILKHRTCVFKRVAKEQMVAFDKKIADFIDGFGAPPRRQVPVEFYDIFRTLEKFSFISNVTVYMPDPKDPAVMWGFRSWRYEYKLKDGFARFFVTKYFEKAMKKAVEGDFQDLNAINEKNTFAFYYPIKKADNTVIAIVRIDGNPNENFREY